MKCIFRNILPQANKIMLTSLYSTTGNENKNVQHIDFQLPEDYLHDHVKSLLENKNNVLDGLLGNNEKLLFKLNNHKDSLEIQYTFDTNKKASLSGNNTVENIKPFVEKYLVERINNSVKDGHDMKLIIENMKKKDNNINDKNDNDFKLCFLRELYGLDLNIEIISDIKEKKSNENMYNISCNDANTHKELGMFLNNLNTNYPYDLYFHDKSVLLTSAEDTTNELVLFLKQSPTVGTGLNIQEHLTNNDTNANSLQFILTHVDGIHFENSILPGNTARQSIFNSDKIVNQAKENIIDPTTITSSTSNSNEDVNAHSKNKIEAKNNISGRSTNNNKNTPKATFWQKCKNASKTTILAVAGGVCCFGCFGFGYWKKSQNNNDNNSDVSKQDQIAN